MTKTIPAAPAVEPFSMDWNLVPVRTVKEAVYACFAHAPGLSHKRAAEFARTCIPTAHTTDRSVASMAVDYRRALAGGGAAPAPRPVGRVKALVEAMFEEGGMTSGEIAAEVRRRLPDAQTTGKSVASMKVDWRRSRPEPTPPVQATAEHFGL